MPKPTPDAKVPPRNIKEVITEISRLDKMRELKPDDFAEEGGYAETFVKELHHDKTKDLKPTQLRRFFHEIKGIRRQIKHGEDYNRTEIALVMPTLAYAVGRRLIPDDFYQLMKVCFGKQRCENQADFERAADFLEAIMAYHKYYEGKKKEKES